LKGFAVAILSFLLFLALGIFGIAFMVQSTILNADFVAGEISRFDWAAMADEYIRIDSSEMPGMEEAMKDAVRRMEPVIEERIDDTLHTFNKYFPGDTENLHLNVILRQDFFTEELVAGIIDGIDISESFGPLISRQLEQSVPVEMDDFDKIVIDAIDSMEPALKVELVSVSGPVFDYILGLSSTLNVSTSLEQVVDVLKNDIYEYIAESAAPELESLPEETKQQYINDIYAQISEQIPREIPIDSTVISPDVPVSFNEALTNAETTIDEVAVYVRVFKMAYIALAVLIILFAAGIFLIIRNVKISSRRIGVPLIIYGALEYAGIIGARYFMNNQTLMPQDVPPELEAWIMQFITNFMRPLEIFSIVLFAVGVIMVVFSYVYKRGDTETPAV
jgi:hypothetical protein